MVLHNGREISKYLKVGKEDHKWNNMGFCFTGLTFKICFFVFCTKRFATSFCRCKFSLLLWVNKTKETKKLKFSNAGDNRSIKTMRNVRCRMKNVILNFSSHSLFKQQQYILQIHAWLLTMITQHWLFGHNIVWYYGLSIIHILC